MTELGLKSLIVFANQWWPHVDTGFQVASSRLKEGRSVALVDLTEILDVGFGQMWPPRASRYGLAPTTRRMFKLLTETFPDRVEILWPDLSFGRTMSDQVVQIMNSATTIQDIQGIDLEGQNLGYSLLSTVYSDAGRTDLSIRRVARMVERVLPQCVALYRWLSGLFETGEFAEVVVFNGRFALERSVLLAASRNGVDVTYHEALADGRYTTLPGSVHSQEVFQTAVERAWSTADPDTRVELADAWFRDRFSLRSADVKRWSRTWEIEDDALDGRKLAGDRPLLAVFPSSDDEFASISRDYDLPGGMSQLDRISSAVCVAKDLGMNVVVRLHPNFSNKSKIMTREWMSLLENGVEVIPPSAPTNSYSLIRQSDIVATCGSTVTVEAAYLGRPTVLLAPSIYSRLEIGVSAYDDLTLVQVLEDSAFVPIEKAKEEAIKVAFFDLVRWTQSDPGFPTMRSWQTKKRVAAMSPMWGLWRRWRRFKRGYL